MSLSEVAWDDEPPAVSWDDEKRSAASDVPEVKWDAAPAAQPMASSHGASAFPMASSHAGLPTPLPLDRVSTFTPPTPKGPTLPDEPLIDVRKVTRDPMYQAMAGPFAAPLGIAAEGLGAMTTPTGIGQAVAATVSPAYGMSLLAQGAADLPAQLGSVAGSAIGGDPEAVREELPGLVTNTAMMVPGAFHARSALARGTAEPAGARGGPIDWTRPETRRNAPFAPEPPPTMPQEAATPEAPASATPPGERRAPNSFDMRPLLDPTRPIWNERGEDVSYQYRRREGGERRTTRPDIPIDDLKIEPVVFEEGVHADDVQTIRAAHETGQLTAEDLRDAGVETESAPVAEAGPVSRGQNAAEDGRGNLGERSNAKAAVARPAVPEEAPVPAEAVRPADVAGGSEETQVKPHVVVRYWPNEGESKASALGRRVQQEIGQQRPGPGNSETVRGLAEALPSAAAEVSVPVEGSAAAVPRLEPRSRKPFASESTGPFKAVGAAVAPGMDSPTVRGVLDHLVEQIRREPGDLGKRVGDAVGGRGLRFAEAVDPRAAQSLAATGSAEPRARLMVGSLITKAREVGIEPETAIKTLIEGQKEGARARYLRLAEEARQAGPDDIHELFRDELRPVFEGLSKGNKFAKNSDVAYKMAPDDLHAYVMHTLESAADQVKINPDGGEVRATPAYQEWLKHYKANFGEKLQKAHEEAGGTTLKDLGPDETYFPLTSESTKPFLSRLTPWKTRPARSAFRTGLGESYSTDMEGLVQATRQILKQDGLHAGLQKLIDSGAIKEYKGKRPPEIQMVNGREVKTITKPLGDGRVLAIPEDLYKEVSPIIDGYIESTNWFKKVFNVMTEIQVGGLTDAAAHGTNVGAAVIYNAPEIAMALGRKALRDTKVLGAFRAWREALDQDPFSPQNRELLHDLGETGNLSSRYGKTSYTKAGAELTGGKSWKETFKENPLKAVFHAAGPSISGPKGIDIRARIAFAKALKELAPEATWGQKVEWMKDLGVYNAALQDGLTRAAKKTGLAPFAVAGRTFNNLGRRLFLNPFKAVPGTTGGTRLASQALHAATSGYAAIGYWWLAHMALTGKTPTEAHANLFEIEPTEDMKRSTLGTLMKLDEPKAKLTANFPYSLPARGARALGLQALWKDTIGSGAQYHPKAGQIMSDMAREALNTAIHPFTGPPVKNMAHLVGIDPYIGSEPPWKGSAWKIPSSIPEGTPGNKVLTEQAKSTLLGANPMLEKLTGGHQSPEGYLADTLLPRLVKHPFKPKKYQAGR